MSVSRAGSRLVGGAKRVWLTVGLVFALTATLLMGLPSQAGAVAGYGDVSETNWYTDAVQWSVDNAITDIEGVCFAPDTPVSRGETAVWIYNMENQPDTGERHSFTDVTDAAQNDAISWMANNEITTGTSPTTFAPDETLRRAQAAAFLHRLKGEPSAPPHNFNDVVAGWQQDPVRWMAHTGITTGTTPTTFAPEDTLTRAQLITFLYRYQGEPEVAVDPASPPCGREGTFQTVSAGSAHSCGVRTNGTITCWGGNYFGSHGQADAPAGMFQTVSASGQHSCGVRAEGTVTCWGYNGDGQTDAPAGAFQTVSAGSSYSCGVRAEGTVTCWGDNSFGQTDAPAGAFQTVSAGISYSCGVRAEGTVTCWGNNYNGWADAPAGAFQTVSAGRQHSCGVRAEGTVTCWGYNGDGQTDAPAGAFQTVSAGGQHSCGVRAEGTVTCWGYNGDGQTDAPAGAFQTVSAGAGHSCGVRAEGTVTCWGDNSFGQVDDSTDWVLHIPPNPVWLEELRAAEAFFRSITHGDNKDVETMKQMWSELVGDDCDANAVGLCRGLAPGEMQAEYSRRACPRGWSLARASWYDDQYDRNMCSHPDHAVFYYPSQAYYPPEEADPRGVRKDHWASNAIDHWASTSG